MPDNVIINITDTIPPTNIATVDSNQLVGNVYTKAQSNQLLTSEFSGNLKISDTPTVQPTDKKWWFAEDIGVYNNAGNLVTQNNYLNVITYISGNWDLIKINLVNSRNILEYSDFKHKIIYGNSTGTTVTLGGAVSEGYENISDAISLKIPVSAGEKILIYTKQGAFTPAFTVNGNNVVTQIFGDAHVSYLDSPLDVTIENDGFLCVNAHEILTSENSKIRIIRGDAYYYFKISAQQDNTYIVIKKTVKKNGTVGTDCDFTDIRDALSAITDNSAKKRYVIYVMDGNYDYSDNGDDIGVRLKNYVILVGQSYNTRIIKRDSVFSWAKAAVDKESGDVEYIGMDGFFTIISDNCKCPVHIDSGKVKYGLFQNLNLINEQDLGTGDNPVDGEANCFALGWNGSDHIVLKNIKANGKLWGHNSTDTQSKGIFEFINCDCRVIQIGDLTSQGQDSIIVKGCNADEFQLLWFSEFTSAYPKRNSFDFTFEGNNIKNAIIKDHAGTHDALEEFYKGKFPFSIAGIHKEYYGTGITKGSDVSKVNNSTVKTWQSGETVFGKALENTDANGRLLIQIK